MWSSRAPEPTVYELQLATGDQGYEAPVDGPMNRAQCVMHKIDTSSNHQLDLGRELKRNYAQQAYAGLAELRVFERVGQCALCVCAYACPETLMPRANVEAGVCA